MASFYLFIVVGVLYEVYQNEPTFFWGIVVVGGGIYLWAKLPSGKSAEQKEQERIAKEKKENSLKEGLKMDMKGPDFNDWDQLLFDWVLQLEGFAHAIVLQQERLAVDAESKVMMEQVFKLRREMLDKLYSLDGEFARIHRNMMKERDMAPRKKDEEMSQWLKDSPLLKAIEERRKALNIPIRSDAENARMWKELRAPWLKRLSGEPIRIGAEELMLIALYIFVPLGISLFLFVNVDVSMPNVLWVFVPLGIGIRAFLKHLRSKAPKWDETVHEWIVRLEPVEHLTDSDYIAKYVFAIRNDMAASLDALGGFYADMLREQWGLPVELGLPEEPTLRRKKPV